MNTNDRNIYDREVGALRNANVLVEIRSKASAFQYAKRRGVSQSSIARFRVRLPGPQTVDLSSQARTRREAKRSVVVRNLNANVTPLEVESLFTSVGRVEHVEIERDTSESATSFAIVRFTQSGSVPKALNFDGSEYDGKIISVFRMNANSVRRDAG
jgi:RNA recognition motif-containing protein